MFYLLLPALIFLYLSAPAVIQGINGFKAAQGVLFFLLSPVWAIIFGAGTIGVCRNPTIPTLYRIVAVVVNGLAFATTVPGLLMWCGMALCSTGMLCYMSSNK
jgi:hypothetical protein